MGKKEKAPTVPAGRVPLVQDGKPLLYPRYSSIEELLQIGKGGKAENQDEVGANGVATGERPSKKQKRAAAAGPVSDGGADSEQPTPATAGKGYGVVGEDGLTYKQRRQLRRAAERAAKAQMDATSTGATAADEPAAKATSAAPEAPSAAAPQNGVVEAGDAKVRKDKKDRKKDKRSRDDQATASADVAAAAAAAAAGAATAAPQGGNADEAARMRAVLGFTSAVTGAGQGGALSLAALVTAAQQPTDGTPTAVETAARAVAGDLGPEEKSEKKRKKDKKGKSKGPDGGEASAPQQEDGEAEQQQPGEGQGKGKGKGETGKAATGAVAANTGDTPAAQPAKPAAAAGHKKVPKSSQPFSFEFQLQDEVEAETQARLARLMALDSTKDGFVPRRVWVSGLPHEYDEDTVREYWSYCGEVESMHQLTFPDSGNFNGTAFITFTTQEGYAAALACNGEMLEGRALRVEKCKAAAELKGKARFSGPGAGADGNEAGRSPAAAGGGGSGKGGRVEGYPVAYCGNISFEAGIDELRQLFVAAGVTPTKVRLHTDKASGRSKGYAHVHFGSGEDVDKAVGLDGTSFHGRKIRVSYAQPKPGETA